MYPSAPAGAMFNGLIFEDQYLEISTQLPTNANVYGLGERVHPYRYLTPSCPPYYSFICTNAQAGQLREVLHLLCYRYWDPVQYQSLWYHSPLVSLYRVYRLC